MCFDQCGSVASWRRFGLRHATLHMAADIAEGSTLYIGPTHRRATVVAITSPFADAPQGTVLAARIAWDRGGGEATVELTKSGGGSDVVRMVVTQSYAVWGLQGHPRNKHKPTHAVAPILSQPLV